MNDRGDVARAVRIARSDDADPSDGYRPNTGALTRAGRLFGCFVALLAVSYAAFLGLLLTGPSPSAPVADPSLGLLTGLAVLLAVGGFAITLARTPRGVARRPGRMVVVEFLGAHRVFVVDGTLTTTVENRYGTGPLSSVPTEMVLVRSARGPARRYLVETGLLGAPAE